MSGYILPILFIAIFCYAKYKKVPAYDTFVKGAKKSIPLALDIFPFIATIMIAVALLRASGLTVILANFFSPIFNLLGIPSELTELVLLRPFTGSGSYALLNDVLLTYGADSYISRCACVILGCSETIFYVTAVYTSQTKVKKLLYAIPIALICACVGSVVACLLCRIM
ncbi:MAG: spore maturation protein [Clostridia bacterium]|nr:spore maturation protein [Clostridia bacterium]MBQ8792670.1 spore maturation protein [Clostridia bacterium]